MPFVVELSFDPSTEACIRDAWKAIDEAVTLCRQIDLPTSIEIKEIGLVEVSPTSCQTLFLCSLKTTDKTELNDELRSAYDETLLKKGIRGKYAKQ